MKKGQLHIGTLIIGSILAFAISFYQFQTMTFPASTGKVKTEQTGDTGKDACTYISLPSFSIPSPVDVQANLNPCCLFEIFFKEDFKENQVAVDLLHPDRFFETMFRVIISPNAP